MSSEPVKNGARAMLRHMVATLAYRASKAVRDAPSGFESVAITPTSRTPSQILAHMGDLFDWALSMAQDRTLWRDSAPQPWNDEVARFFGTLTAFDEYLAGSSPISPATLEKLAQGPIADALTHTGQLTYLRRIGGRPVRGESYARAEITTGRTGFEQAAPRLEFD
jgi:hypothetical protein